MTTPFKVKPPILAAIISVGAGLLANTPASAADQVDQAPVLQLGPHRFTPTAIVPDPFVHTYVRNSLGMGQAYDLDYPPIEIDGEPVVGLQGNMIFALLDFEYQHAIKDWIAVSARVRVTGRLGSDVQSLVSSGVTAATGFELGWLLKLLKTESTALSASAELSNRSFTTVDLARWVEGIIGDQPAPLVGTTPSARGGLGARFAWGISRPFGLTVDGNVGYGESVSRDSKNEVYVRGGTSLSFDLSAVSSVPLGFVGGIHHDSFPEGGEDISGGVTGGLLRIAYTGRDDFIIAIDAGVEKLQLDAVDSKVKFGTITMNLRYYF